MPLGTLAFELPERLHRDAGGVASVTTIIGPREAGPFPTEDEIRILVEHTLTFFKKIQGVYCLGDNLPPIAVVSGRYASGGAAGHEEDDTSVHYCLNGCSFSSLGSAIIAALAQRDRGNPNDARYTALAMERLLTAVD